MIEALGLKHPLVVAPMAGGPSTVELVTAVADAGALGMIAGAYLTPGEIEDFARSVRARTARAIGINLFVPAAAARVSEDAVARARRITRPVREQLSLDEPELQPPFEIGFDRQFEAVLKVRPRVFSFVFGCLHQTYVQAARAAGLFVIGAATTEDEALAVAAAGVDAVVIQGLEAGGHRFGFAADAPDADLGLFELLGRLRGRIGIPMIAAGGLMTKSEITRALGAGATAVQMGTAFLATREAGTAPPYRTRLTAPGPRRTELTRAFSGRLARGIGNAFTALMADHPDAVLPYPAQNVFTRDIRRASLAADSSEAMALWCGAGAGDVFTGGAAELIARLFEV